MGKIQLGDKVRDRVTGFEGVVIGGTQWHTGCTTYGVKPLALKDSAPIDAVWIDEIQLEIVKKAFVEFSGPKDQGGPCPTPQRSVRGS